jgi:pyruvate dehydrogenase E2 component (dihydrolipoamide acetyltransferase)
MPKQGLQMTEGTIVEWLVSEGGKVVEGEPFFIIETDKVTITMDALVSGVLLKIVAQVGDVVPITGTIAIVGTPGEDISALLAGGHAVPGPPPAAAGVPVSGAAAGTAAGVPASGAVGVSAAAGSVPQGRVFISPRAKTRAGELGIDFKTIRGSGPDGMIVERDVLAAAQTGTGQAGTASKATPLAEKVARQAGVNLAEVPGAGLRGKIYRADVDRAISSGGSRQGTAGERRLIPMKGMRKVIAERMKQSQNENAQTCHRISVRMDEAVRLRISLDKTVGYNDLVAFATVRALRDFPAINAELTAGGIWQKDFVNLGVAVAIEGGLIVPVVRDADLLSLAGLASEIKALAEKARTGGLQPNDYTGGSFTLSNLGMYGLEEFVAIINPPEAGILAVGKIEDTPVAVKGSVEIHPVMKLTLSYDHRVVDGAPAAEFLARIREYLENPFKLL